MRPYTRCTIKLQYNRLYTVHNFLMCSNKPDLRTGYLRCCGQNKPTDFQNLKAKWHRFLHCVLFLQLVPPLIICILKCLCMAEPHMLRFLNLTVCKPSLNTSQNLAPLCMTEHRWQLSAVDKHHVQMTGSVVVRV